MEQEKSAERLERGGLPPLFCILPSSFCIAPLLVGLPRRAGRAAYGRLAARAFVRFVYFGEDYRTAEDVLSWGTVR